MNVQNIELVIEKDESGMWGRVNYNDNLIIEQADNLDDLESKLKMLLKDFEGVAPESIKFDLRKLSVQFRLSLLL
ncbi:MAG TPA: hypothetical protein VIM16_04550 [Mucilaginibacter sp.]|jgi:hypothetical protein